MERGIVLVAVLGSALAVGGARADVHNFTVPSMDGAQETPPNGSTSTGTGTFTLDDVTGIATFNITHDCCATGETVAHVHGPAAPGVGPAAVIYPLPAGSPKVGSSPALTAQQQADMLAGLHYVNVHSTAFSGGEIRGQIILVRSKCTSKKLKLAGKKTAAFAKCHATSVGKGTTLPPGCFTSASAKFSTGWTKAEGKGGCLTTGDESAIEGKVDAFDGETGSALQASLQTGPGPSKCTSLKFKAAGKKASARFKCHAKAAGKGLVVDQLCLQKATDKFSASYAKADLRGDCQAGTGDTAAIETDVDNFVDDVVTDLIPGATATTTTTTTTTTAASTTTTTAAPLVEVQGALTATPGRFNYNLMLGLPGANAACNSSFPGTHACEISELQGAPASDLMGLKDTANMTVTSFWAIDPVAPILQQCNDDQVGGSDLNWEYGTADTPSRGSKVTLNSGTGALGSVTTGLQCNLSGNSWVGCCL